MPDDSALTNPSQAPAAALAEAPNAQAETPLISILMPVRNEGLNLAIMLKILRSVVECPHEILVVYDTPGDSSVDVVDRIRPGKTCVRAIHNTLGPGVINAIRTGVKEARGEFVLIFAADEVGPVLALDDMLFLMKNGCGFVSCTRYAHGGRRLGGSWIGGVLSRLANWLFHLIAGSALTDSTTGIKMFRRELFEKLNPQARPIGWAVTFELAIKAQAMGLTMGEVPIVSIDRLYGGRSTFRLFSWFAEYLRWFLWGAFELRKHPRPKVLVRLPSVLREVSSPS